MERKILALDFDGVLNNYISKGNGMTLIPDGPVEGAVEFVKEAVKHFDVYIHSTRCNTRAGCEAIYRWLKKWGFPADDVSIVQMKPPAHMFIDDRCFHFTGNFPSMDYIHEFDTWNADKKKYRKVKH